MALSAPRALFGIHSATPFSRTTGLPYGILKLIGGSTLSLVGETIDLFGGSSKFAWHSENGKQSSEMNWKVKSYEDFLIELFLGTAPTANAAETGGAIATALTNFYGATVLQASTGIASVSVLAASEANLKNGRYVLKALSATTVGVYAMSDYDFDRGTDITFIDDNLKCISAAQTITSGGNTDIASLGLRIAGGSGTIGMTTGHTAYFDVRAINTKSSVVTVGNTSASYPEFGALCVAQKRGNGELCELEVFRVKQAGGLTFDFTEEKFSETDLKMKCLYDSAKDGVFTYRHISAA